MRKLYEENSANYPRLTTDRFFVDFDNVANYEGFFIKSINFIKEFQLLRADLFTRFAKQFTFDSDYENGWRGEYWGKMMRGACFTYSATRDEKLLSVLKNTISEIFEIQEKYGRVSTYAPEKAYNGWDLWCRKYILLGMQYFLEISDDSELNEKIVKSMCAQVDDIMKSVGEGEDKVDITLTTNHWRGLNSSSILEPVVRLYSITKEQRYFDFAQYIVNCGGTDVENIFELAFEDKFYPYQYPVTKAYEMTSCFEGLLEFYRLTGIEKYKTAVINYANKILESDFTIIGSCGCTHELFDHSTVRQANTNNEKIMQETCVTVTLMKFFYQLLILTGDFKYADAIEISAYNAYFGAINTEKVIEPTIKRDYPDLEIEPLPFDSYSPLTAGTRGNGIGGFKIMADNHYYGCCACIGAAGFGIIHKVLLLSKENGFAYNFFFEGSITSKTPKGNKIKLITKTEYPKHGKINVKLELEKPEAFEFSVRNPGFSKNTKVFVNGEEIKTNEGYVNINREWKNGDEIDINVELVTRAVYPIPYGHQIIMNKVIWGHNYMVATYDTEDEKAKNHIALMRGPVVLAQENRLGYSVDEPITIKVNADNTVDTKFPENDIAPYEHLLEMEVPLKNGKTFRVTDYQSAGKLWTEESKMAAWILTE